MGGEPVGCREDLGSGSVANIGFEGMGGVVFLTDIVLELDLDFRRWEEVEDVWLVVGDFSGRDSSSMM